MTKLYVLAIIALSVQLICVSAIVDHIKKGVDTVANGVKDVGAKAIDAGFDLFCKPTGAIVPALTKQGINFLKCDTAHKKEPHCEFLSNAPMMHAVLCDVPREEGKELFTLAVHCFTLKDQDCLKKWGEKLCGYKETVETLMKQAKIKSPIENMCHLNGH
ncbi:unnamed protein product [Medioppia subpectinata]|uniref:Uncharacterized protein n=1 Tax=Medioppia subpectinata TaxID=1979941 RepID=A0A7R9KRA5_9ACAR|nr:unnamed protein product [Medioppia subpectinata]CAG2108355.1 unnamed protein product [Medioppia subpectinata]